MSSSYTSPRAGGTKPASTEEISARSTRYGHASKTDVDGHVRHRQADQKYAGKPGDGDPG